MNQEQGDIHSIHSSRKSLSMAMDHLPLKQANSGSIAFNIANMVQQKSSTIHSEYEMKEILGKGAYGEVRKGYHRKIPDILRAIKIIQRVKMNEDEKIRLQNEVNVLKTLDHPNIIKVYEFYQDNSYFYIVTELCTGGELFDRIIKNNFLSEKKAASIIKDVMSAVYYMNSKNIVHRDLKPENILYLTKDEDSLLKVIDFGTSRVFKKNEALQNVYGTVYYIAPEVLVGDYNEKCDVWSCGVILYVMLSGSPPFGGSTDKEIIACVKQGIVNFDQMVWEYVSQQGKDMIMQMLVYDKRKRPSMEKLLQNDWLKNQSQKKETPVEMKKVLGNLKNFRVVRLKSLNIS